MAKRNRKEKKYHLDHLIEAEAEIKAKEQPKKEKEEIIQNDIISKKTEALREMQVNEQKNINKDVTFSVILTVVFMSVLGVIYFFEQQSQFMSSLSKNLMDLLLQR